MTDAVSAAIEQIQATSAEMSAAMREQARELGQRRAQVMLLREALARHGGHPAWCDATLSNRQLLGHCTCGLADHEVAGANGRPDTCTTSGPDTAN